MRGFMFLACISFCLLSCDDNRPDSGSTSGPGTVQPKDSAAVQVNQTLNSTDIGGDTTRGKTDSGKVNR
jgi:hypothetical protein